MQEQTLEEIIKKRICREFYFRSCIKYDGYDQTFVIVNGDLLRPSHSRRSKSGAHGEDVYCIEEDSWRKAWILSLGKTNSGRRYASFENVPEVVAEVLHQAWEKEGASADEIVRAAIKFYRMLQK